MAFEVSAEGSISNRRVFFDATAWTKNKPGLPDGMKLDKKFMITWQFHQGKLHEGYSQFFKMTPEQDAADRGSRIKQIGRWHDLARGRGVVICESDSAEAVASWALNWNSLLDVDVVPVLDDNETRALDKSRETSS
jgi:hypothetical protein